MPNEKRIREVAAVYKPRGWKIREHDPWNGKGGSADPKTRTITCPPLTHPYALYVFLHEVGHIRCGHLRAGVELPRWLQEYEAEMWAMQAMRAASFKITDEMKAFARLNVERHVLVAWHKQRHHGHEEEIDLDVLKFIFPETWREHI